MGCFVYNPKVENFNHFFFQKLLDQYPNVDVQMFVGGEEVGVNPKINNMTPAYRASKYPFILVSDAGIKSEFDINHLDIYWCI